MRIRRGSSGGLALVLVGLVAATVSAAWPRHTVDNTSAGADGVRLADINGDGCMDIATGWEEGGLRGVSGGDGGFGLVAPAARGRIGA